LLPFSSSRGHTDEDNKRGSQLKINCAEFLTSTFKWAQAKQHRVNAAPQSLRMLILPSVSIFWSVMITGLSTMSLVLGTTIAYLAGSYPEHRAVMETVGGILLIGGFGLMGFALEAVLGHPLP
jgi:hypothetical protein